MDVQFLLLPGQLDMSDGAGCPLHISLREPHWNLVQGHHGTTLKSPLICQGDLHQHLAALQPSLPLYHRAPPLVDPVPQGQDDQGGESCQVWKYLKFGRFFKLETFVKVGSPVKEKKGGGIRWPDAHTMVTVGAFVTKVNVLKTCNQLVPQGGGTSAGFPLHGLLLDLWPPISWEG